MPGRYADPIFAREKVRRRRRFPVILLLMLIILLIGTALVNGFINRQIQVIRQSVTVPSLPSALEGFRILHISDLHGASFGNGQEDLFQAVRSLNYQAAVITGDSIARDGDDAQLMNLIALLNKSVPVFLIAGDEDPPPILTTAGSSAEVKAAYIRRAESFGATYLDAPYPVTVGKGTIWFCPDDVYDMDVANARRSMQDSRASLSAQPPTESTQAALRAVDYWLDRIDRIEQALLQMKSGDLKICVTHAPYLPENLAELRYDDAGGLINNAKPAALVLAGHYNNGQFRLPGLGPVYMPAKAGLYAQDRWFPGDNGLSGLSTLYGISQYISPGLGSSGLYTPFSIRFMNPPSVTLLTLTSKLVY